MLLGFRFQVFSSKLGWENGGSFMGIFSINTCLFHIGFGWCVDNLVNESGQFFID